MITIDVYRLGVKHQVIMDESDFVIVGSYKLNVWKSRRSSNFYARMYYLGKTQKLHRVIMGVSDPNIIIDHINGNSLDNRKVNLRITDARGNARNCRKTVSKTVSRYKGVDYQPKCTIRPWRARIQGDAGRITIGTFSTESEAALAYNQAAIKHHGEFAVLNEITSNQEEYTYDQGGQ